ncbi:MAG: ABC transporter permease [Dehalococcoidia bacterium]
MSASQAVPVIIWPARVSIFQHLSRLAGHWELFLTLLLRDIKVRYRQSVLGLYWAVLHPVAIALVFTLAFSFIVRISTGDVPYFLFALAGLPAWNFFGHGLADSTESLVRHTNLVTKVAFPKELLPLSSVCARALDFFGSLIVVVALSLILGQGIHPSLLWVPFVFILLTLFTTGLGLFFAMSNLYFRDMRQVVTVLLPLWMYMTPIIYPPDLVPEAFRFLLWLNPLAGLVTATRNAVLYGTSPDWLPLLSTVVATLVVLTLAYVLFKRKEPAFAEVV